MSLPTPGGPTMETQLVAVCHDLVFPGLVSIYLFGSAANGRTHRESDIDLGVYFDYTRFPSSDARFAARLELTSVLSHSLGRDDLDVVVLNDAPPTFSRRILEGKRVYCADPEVDHALLRTVLIRAADLDPFLRKVRRVALEALSR